MRRRPQSRQYRRRAGAADDTYQLDVIVSLFAIMLVILVALTSARGVLDASSHLEYRTEAPSESVFMQRSIQIPYGAREIWVVGAQQMFRLDRTEIVRRVQNSRIGTNLSVRDDTVFVRISALSSTEPTWTLSVHLGEGNAANWIRSELIELKDSEALQEFASRRTRVLLVVRPNGVESLGELSSHLRRTRRPHIFVPRSEMDTPITLSYRRRSFAYDKILRAY